MPAYSRPNLFEGPANKDAKVTWFLANCHSIGCRANFELK
jgi:hypothetical protein